MRHREKNKGKTLLRHVVFAILCVKKKGPTLIGLYVIIGGWRAPRRAYGYRNFENQALPAILAGEFGGRSGI